MSKQYRIAHVGAFDMENFGDLLFVDVVERHLRRRLPIKEIVYFSPQTTTIPNKGLETHRVSTMYDFCKEEPFDAIIVGGGDLVHLEKVPMYLPHISEEWITYDVLHMWVIPALIAEKFDIPLLWNAPGVPRPFIDEDKHIVSLLCEAVDYISVRDRCARDVLAAAVDADRIHVVPDSVLSISRMITREDLKEKYESTDLSLTPGKYLFFQANTAYKEEELRTAIDCLRKIANETGYQILVQSIGYSMGDEAVITKLVDAAPDLFVSSGKHLDQFQILSLIANAGFYIGTSLHGSIVSTSYGVPNIICNINHYNKTDGFLALIDNSDACVTDIADIESRFHLLVDRPPIDLSPYLARIDQHFDTISKAIEAQAHHAHISSYEERLADYIYLASERRRMMQREIERYDVHVANIERFNRQFLDEANTLRQQLAESTALCQRTSEELASLRQQLAQAQEEKEAFRSSYEEILHSAFWRASLPIRRILDRRKK